MSKTSDDCDPTFSRNADGTRVSRAVEARLSELAQGLEHSVEDAMRKQFERIAAEKKNAVLVEPPLSDESAAVRRMVRSLERDFGAVIVEKTDFHRALDDAFFSGFQTTIDLRIAALLLGRFDLEGAYDKAREQADLLTRKMPIVHCVDSCVWEESPAERKARARNEKRLSRGYRPRHVRASV